MDDPDHKDLLIQQLKDIVRSNEEILKKKEKQLEESNAKYQKLKLQSRAKIAQLTSQAKAQHEASPEGEQGEDASKPSNPHHDSTADVSRGRVRVLKHQLDEAKSQLQKKENEMQELRQSFESTVERLEKQLLQRDQALMESAEASSGQVARQSSGQRQDGIGSSTKEEERLYAQMVYKDSKILELNNQILELERRILDLQENLREKDQVLQARSKAIQLMTEDLSLRNKTTVDDLDDTRAEMRQMQQNFLEQEMSWKQREASLTADLDSNKNRVVDLEEGFRRLESTRFQLATHNAELQEKVVRLQETVDKVKAEQVAAFQAKVDSLSKELEEKTTALEETRKTLKETTKEMDAKILKARALERRRAKQFERELNELKKGKTPDVGASPSEVTTLQQRVAELEEEKGALQLKALEMEDALSSQATKLEEMASKDRYIDELKGLVKAARDEKISLEVQAAQLEEHKDLEEQKMRELQLELEALKAAGESSAPALQQELKAALEEEVKKLLMQHEQDSSVITELQQKLQLTEGQLASAITRATELDAKLQKAVHDLEEKTHELENLTRVHEEERSEAALKSSKIQELETLLKDAQERLEASTSKARESERACEVLRISLSASTGEADRLRQALEDNSTHLQKALEDLRIARDERDRAGLALQSMQEQLEHHVMLFRENNQHADDNVAMLTAQLEDLQNIRTELERVQEQLQAKQSEVDEISARESQLRSEHEKLISGYGQLNTAIKDVLAHIGAMTMDEVKVVWDRSILEKENIITGLRQELSEAVARSEQLMFKTEQLEEALKDVDLLKTQLTAVNACLESLSVKSLEELKSRWNVLHENLDLLSQSQKVDKEELDSRIKQLVDEKAELQLAIETKEHQVSELTAEVDRLRLLGEESGKIIAERESALSEALRSIEELQSRLDAEHLKTESKVSTLLEQCSDLEREVSSLQLKVEEREQSILDLTGRLNAKEVELQDSAHSFAFQEAALQELVEGSKKQFEAKEKDLSEATREVTFLRERLQAKEEEMSLAQSELTSLADTLEKVRSENKSLENRLKKMHKKTEAISSKSRETESSLKSVQQELETVLSEKADLENSCHSLKEQLARLEEEKGSICQQLSEVSLTLETCRAERDSFSRQVEESQVRLSSLESDQLGRETEMQDTVNRLQMEKDDLTLQIQQLDEVLAFKSKENEELSVKLSLAGEHLNKVTQRNQQLEEKLDDVNRQNKRLEEERCHFAEELDKQTALYNSKLDELQQSWDSAKSELIQATKELEGKHQELEAAKEQLQELQQLYESTKELNCRQLGEVSSLQVKVQEAEDMLRNEGNEKSHLLKQVEGLKESLSAKADEFAQLRVAVSSKDAELDSLKQNAESQQSDLLVKVSELSRDLQQKTGELSLIETALQERDILISNLKALLEESSRSGKELEGTNRELVAQVQALEGKVEEVSKQIETKEEDLQKATENLRLLENSLEERLQVVCQLQEANNKLTEGNHELVREVNEANAAIASLREKLAGEEHIQASFKSELESAKSETNSLVPQLEGQRKKISDLENQLTASTETQVCLLREVEKLQREKQTVSDTLKELESKLQAAESGLQDSTETINTLRAEVQQLQGWQDKMHKQHEADIEESSRALLEKENQLVDLQGQVETLSSELTKKKEQLARVSAEIESLVTNHDVQLRELLEAESSARTECSNLSEKLSNKENEVLSLMAQLEDVRLENSRAKEQIAMFSSEIQNLIQNHDQQLREFADTNSKLEAEVSNYMTKVGECDERIRDLEARLSELHQENTALRDRAEHASNEVNEMCQRHHIEAKNLELQIERLQEEQEHLKIIEKEYQQVVAELQKSKEESQVLKETLNTQGNQTQELEKTPVVEEIIVPKEAQLLYTTNLESSESEIAALQQELDMARVEAQMARESLLDKEEAIRRLTEHLAIIKSKLEETEQQLKGKKEEAQHVHSVPENPPREAQQDESKESADAELKKLKLAFKKSRGELRLKVKILEDRTKEVEKLKEQNSSLQKELEQLVETLDKERTSLKKYADDFEERDKQIVQMAQELQGLGGQLALEAETNTSLSKELQTARAELHSLRTQMEELNVQGKGTDSLESEIHELKKQLESTTDALKLLSADNEALKARSSRDTEQLLSELQSSKAELQRLSAEHEDALDASLNRERVLQGELDAATDLIQQLHSEHADFSRMKSEEFGLLQGQLESLSGDLVKQLEIVDSKVEEANALQSKLQTSQLQLEKFSAEYSILQDVLLQECGECPPGDMTFMGGEFSAFEYLKWLLESVRKRREALESSLAEKDEQLSSLQDSHQSLAEKFSQTLQCLGELLIAGIQTIEEPGRLEDVKMAVDSKDHQALLRAVSECVTSMANTKLMLSKEAENLRLSCEEVKKKLNETTAANEQWQCRWQELQESLRKEEQPASAAQITRLDKSLQTEVEDELLKEKGQEEASLEKEQMLTQIAALKEEMALLKAQPSMQGSGDGDKLNSELAATKLKSEKLLVKLKLFKEKNDVLVKQLNALRDSHAELEHSYQKKSDEVSQLESQCCSLQEDLQKALTQSEHAETLALSLEQATSRARDAETECSVLRDKIGDLLDQNSRLEIESKHLKSELADLKEQAEMLSSDNEAFQNLAENLKRARQNLEQELKTQHEQHTKTVKDLENRYQKQLEEKNSDEAATAALRHDFAQMQEKYNQILYRHRDLEEEFHVVVEEKKKLEARCTQLAEDLSAANQALALMEKQASVGHKTVQEYDLLRQEHQQLQERLHQLKSSQLKAEERLVQTVGQESASLKAKLHEAETTIEDLKAAKEQTTSEEVRRLQQQLNELSQRHATVIEQSQAKEGKWNQERKQLKHIEEHLKQAAMELSTECEKVRSQHEETLKSNQDLRNQMEQVHKDNKALTQQVQNWRSYIKDLEGNQADGGQSAEVKRLQMELEQTATQLHQLGLRNEEMSVDLSKVLEEKSSLKQLLSHTQEVLRQREAQLLRLQSSPFSRDGSHVIEIEHARPAADDSPNLHSRLEECERQRRELEERVEELADGLRTERQRRHLLEGELGDIEWGVPSPSRLSLDESHHLLLHDDVVKIPATNYSITRQFMSHASKLRRWLQGRQDTSGHSVHHI